MHEYKPLFTFAWGIARGRFLPALAISLMLMMVAGPTFATGEDDSSGIAAATAEDLMAQLLQKRGLTPPADSGLSLADYIESNAGQEGMRRVWVSIGPDGNIVPKPEWQQQHPEYCKQRARDTSLVEKRLRFKLYRNAETHDGKTRYQYDVFAGVVDDATGKIKSQQEGQSTILQDSNAKSGFMENPDADGLAGPMGEALDRLDVKLGAPVGPCGEIRLEHISGTQVKQPVAFQAGFQGSYGRYLEYIWDFGDGSGPEEIGKRAQHVYAKQGTYAVTVRVEGKNIEPGSNTISVVIGDDEIQPRDGTWAIKLTNHRMLGCSPRIANAAKSGMTKLVDENQEHTVTFAKPFHPEPLMKHSKKKLHWEHTGRNQWKTEISRQESKAMSMSVVLEIEVISPTRINEVGTHNIDVSPMFVKMLGGSAHCRAIGDYELTWLH